MARKGKKIMTSKTNRYFYERIAKGEMDTEIQTWATEQIESLDKKNSARKAKNAQKRSEKAVERAGLILPYLETPKTAKQVAEQFEMTVQGAASALRQFVEDGVVEKTPAFVNGKATTVYSVKN